MGKSSVAMANKEKDITNTLTDIEKQALKKYEAVIRKGLGTFLEVGHALAEIRDRRLYREFYKTFELYCRKVWGLSKTHANRYIGGYETVRLLESQMAPMGAKIDPDQGENPSEILESQEIVLPVNERQTRPLTKLKPDDQVAAGAKVLEYMNENPKAKLTAALVAQAVREVKGEVVKKKVDNTRAEVGNTALVSNIFKRQYQVLLDVVMEERNQGWRNTKKAEVIRHLEALILLVEED